MDTYPLLFSFHDVVAGNGFFAGVTIDGRALLEEDEEGAWFYGVEPGSLAGHGSTRQEAHQDFRAGYRSVLADIAYEVESFSQFEVLARDFLCTINGPTEADWKELVGQVRSGDLNLNGPPRRDADLARKVTIMELELEEDRQSVINDPKAQSSRQSLAA